MSRLRINSSPDLMFNTSEQFHDDSALEGNVCSFYVHVCFVVVVC